MATYHQQHEEEGKSKEEIKEGPSSSIQSPVSAPSSTSTSPSHEFSFTISLHSSSDLLSDYKTKTPSSVAADLSPADDIFFHGHLLPLHLLPDSHLPASPRLSTSSLDSFNVTGRESFNYPTPVKVKPISNIRKHERVSHSHSHNTIEAKVKNKSKSFSLFSLKRLQKGGVNVRETEEKENEKKKIGFDASHVLKRYMRMIRPLLLFRRKRENNLHPHSQAYSFSGNLSSRGRRGGYYSAPCSMRTSPSHSGLLVATKGSPSSTSDSTMEELQAAIQSAIAHCKNSIKGEQKLKC